MKAFLTQRNLGVLSVLFSISPFILEMLTYTGSIQNNIGLSASLFSLVCLITIFFLRNHFEIPRILTFFGFVITLSLSLIFGYLESNNYPNYIYSMFHLNYPSLVFMSLVFGCLSLIATSRQWLLKNWKQLVFFLGCIFFIYGVAFWLIPMGYFLEIVKEGRAVETMQFLSLILTAGFNLWTLFKLRSLTKLTTWQKYLYTAFFSLFGLGCFVLAGEEVAWGQHWFGFTNQAIQANNLQNEITVHNNSSVAKYIFQAYVFVSLYGSLSWLALRAFCTRLKNWFFLFTEWYTTPYFALLLGYQIQQTWFGYGELIKQWAEFTELGLYLGFVFIAIRNYQHLLIHFKK